jgi:hypothetical protein
MSLPTRVFALDPLIRTYNLINFAGSLNESSLMPIAWTDEHRIAYDSLGPPVNRDKYSCAR